ncbi:AmmeMemoRadiSam system protein B [archaeon]|nr:AmmeMemoRadiSam system protein B [archaeon]|tara:strand:- start:1176 stop:2051 length:876 start_codon:yes stop_codon:yes gene_type:complete
MNVRRPIVTGQFYSGDFEKLEEEIKETFLSKFGPGDLPIKKRDKKIFGIISPHAGYKFSGPCQAWSYKEIAESRMPETYVILGPNHTGLGSNFSMYYEANWETPFGIVKVDDLLGRSLLKKCRFLQNDVMAHLHEHSIEVQLPFLQYVNKDSLKDLKFLPISISNFSIENCKKLAEAIVESNKNINIIVSSDFTHYGENYKYTPFTYNKKENLYELDNEAMDFIKNLDSEGFFNFVEKKKTTICGVGPIIVAIEACKLLGAKKARLLHYYTSGDVTDDYNNAVGYGGLVFE